MFKFPVQSKCSAVIAAICVSAVCFHRKASLSFLQNHAEIFEISVIFEAEQFLGQSCVGCCVVKCNISIYLYILELLPLCLRSADRLFIPNVHLYTTQSIIMVSMSYSHKARCLLKVLTYASPLTHTTRERYMVFQIQFSNSILFHCLVSSI